MAIEAQNGNYDLTYPVIVYNKTASSNGTWDFELKVGDLEDYLDSAEGILSWRIILDGETLGGCIQNRNKGVGIVRIREYVGPVYIASGQTIAITLESSNAADDGVDVTITPHEVEPMRGTDGANTTTPPSATQVVDEWKSQSQADPTLFHVNLKEWDGTPVTTSSTTNKPEVDAASISDSSTAANNIESVFLGTGHSDGIKMSAKQLKLYGDNGSDEGSLHCENINANGIGQRNKGFIGQANNGSETGQSNAGDVYGQQSYGGTAAVYVIGNLGVSGTFSIGGNAVYMLSSPDSGVTQIMRTGADGDTAKTLSDQLDTVGTNQTTILARLGAWTGSGINTILGAFKALLSKDASAPSDIGGTFSPSADSVEAVSEAIGLLDGVVGIIDGSVGDILVNTGTTLPSLIADIPTVAEFEARTKPSDGYFNPTTDEVTTDSASREASKANVSALATSSALTTVDSVVDAIKLLTDKLSTMLEADGDNFKYTSNALQEVASTSVNITIETEEVTVN